MVHTVVVVGVILIDQWKRQPVRADFTVNCKKLCAVSQILSTLPTRGTSIDQGRLNCGTIKAS